MFTSRDFLDPLHFVSSNSNYVSIDQDAVNLYVNNFSLDSSDHWTKSYPLDPLPSLPLKEQIDFFFLMGSQAFCFWGNPKWTVEYKGKSSDGWWALVACFHRAIEQGIPVTDSQFLALLSLDQTRVLFEGNPEIPLLKERHKILQHIGEKMAGEGKKSFHTYLIDKERNALELVELISSFEGFDDISVYKGRKIPFYKKAQVVISDLNIVLNGQGKNGIQGMELLPGHADYKIPAQLRKFGILSYSRELEQLIDNKIEIPQGSEMEVEIRANQLWAIYLIVERLRAKYPRITASDLNGILWVQSQTKDPKDKPYHLTKTIYY